MNWAKLIEQVKVKPKTSLIGCGILPGFGPKMYDSINSKWNDLADQYPEFEIDRTSLSLFRESELQGMINVTTPLREAYDEHKTGSVLDSRFGTTEKSVVCGTCCQTVLTCPGHYGYFQIKKPLIHPLYQSHLLLVLEAVCHNCGHLIQPLTLIDDNPLKRLQFYAKRGAALRRCHHCSFMNKIVIPPKTLTNDQYRSYKGDLFEHFLPGLKMTQDDQISKMSIAEIDKVLGLMGPEAKLGTGMELTDPRSLIMRNIIVTPIVTRPGTMLTGVFENSGMTSMYDYLLRLNRSESDQNTDNQLFRMIYRTIYATEPKVPYIDIFINLKEQLSKKAGHFRSSAMGKRINYCSRTVLSPASETSIGEMSYPSEAARQMSVPEVTSQYNINRLREEWRRGEIMAIVPMTTSHPQYGQTLFFNSILRETYQPYLLDICHRFIRTGDMVFFNRQPTLSRYSLMGYQAKLVPRNIRVHGINSCATKPHNADFDGDEGNVYIPQTLEAQAEARLISGIRNNIISASYGKPIVSIQYHGLINLWNLTKDDVVLDPEDWEAGFKLFWGNRGAFIPGALHGYSNLMQYPMPDPSDFLTRLGASGINRYSGKALFSCLLPSDLYYNKKNSQDVLIKIRSGILLTGPLSKSDMGGANMGLVHVMSMYGNEVCSDFLSSAQKMSDWYDLIHTTSLSWATCRPTVPQNKALGDYYLDTSKATIKITDDFLELIHKEYQVPGTVQVLTPWVSQHRDVLASRSQLFGLDQPFQASMDTIVSDAYRVIQEKVDALPSDVGMTEFEKIKREGLILSITGKTNKEDRARGLKLLGKTNALKELVDSGAKGSDGNFAQMTTSIGQTAIHGKRPGYVVARTREFPQGSKTMIFYQGKDEPDFKESIASRGYVNSSYTRGTDGAQYVFMMDSERIGVITSRTATADSGYLGRQILKFNEDIRVSATGDVVSAQDRYISPTVFDGLDVTKSVGTSNVVMGKVTGPINVDFIVKKLIGQLLVESK